MFFSITTSHPDNRFVIHEKVNKFFINTDSGWSKTRHGNVVVFYKGYCDTCLLSDLVDGLIKDPSPKTHGNFCFIIVDIDDVTITHDIYRSFPLRKYDDCLTNLLHTDDRTYMPIWADSYTLYDGHIVQVELINSTVDINKISINECTDKIQHLLIEKTKQLPDVGIKTFVSGGIDTGLVYSLLKHSVPNSYELVTSEHFDFTEFTIKNYKAFKTLPEFWAYRQFHHWRTPTMFATGSMGDEIFMRGPVAISIWCAWHGIDFINEIHNAAPCYHEKYFLKEKNQAIFNENWKLRGSIQSNYLTYEDLCQHIYNMISNDHQHWHLENTITWTPLKDLRILSLVLSLSPEDLLSQMINATLNKKIIKQLNPEFLNCVSAYKNFDSYENLLNYQPYVDQLIT